MRFPLFLLAFWLLLMVAPSNASAPPAGGPYDAQWKKIDALLAKDQTAAAQQLVLGIYQKARAGRQTADYVRALVYRLHLLEEREEDADEKGIQLLEADLPAATFPARPLLHSLLAEQYHQYLQQNRYRLHDRTTVGQPAPEEAPDLLNNPDGADLATWDAARLAARVVRHYRASVETDAARQQQTKLAALGRLATFADAQGTALRPTLYDLLAHRAIEGLADDELYLTRPAEQFRFNDAKLFGPDAEFVALPLTAPAADSLNGPLHALRIWQQLTRFHQGSPAAVRADVERLRLAYVYRFATPPAAARSGYEAALRRAQQPYQQLPAWADFQVDLAQLLQQRGEPAEAVQLAREAIKRFPKSVGAARAQSLLNDLERPVLSVQTAQVQLPGQALLLSVQHRNLDKVYGYAWRISGRAMLDELLNRRESEIGKAYAKRLSAAPAATWQLSLPGPADYKVHRAELASPALPVGHYLLALSTAAAQPTKERADISTVYAFVTVSELGLVHRAAPTGGTDLWTLQRATGQPLGGVQVQPWFIDYQNGRRYLPDAAQPTAADGHLTLPYRQEQRRYMQAVLLSRGRDSLVIAEGMPGRPAPDNPPTRRPQRRAFVYTDRAIYRPGQTLYFKGIVAQEQDGRSAVLKNLPVRLQLLDVNGQQVLEQPFTTSDYGSFHGELTLPASLLNGEMQLVVKTADNNEQIGYQGFAVEDYKRPTFFVTLDPVTGRPKLGDTLSVRGTATAYAGPAVDGATVRYRVVRRTQWPLFGWAALDFGFGGEGGSGSYRRPYYPGGAEQQIATGTVQTDAQGHFRISFTAAAPDDADTSTDDDNDEDGGYRPPRPGRPTYVFEVVADVTDPNGETRSEQRNVPLGGSALNLTLSGAREINQQRLDSAFSLRSQNAAGETVPAAGTVRLYQLTPPARVLHPRSGPRPDQPGLPREEHQKLFPHDAWLREDDAETWPKRLVGEWPFDTKQGNGLPEVSKALATQTPGAYLLEAQSLTGADTARARLGFTLYNPTAARLPLPLPVWLTEASQHVRPGQPVQVLIGSGFDKVPVRLEVESRGQLLRAEWLTLSNEQRLISVPNAPEGPLYVRLVLVQDGRFYQRELTIMVNEPPRPLALDISTFRDKLQPGQQETWRVTIKNSQSQPAAAELLATLYDQSLDYFRPHRYQAPQIDPPYFGPRFGWGAHFNTVPWQTLLASFEGKPVGQAYYLYPELRMDYWQWWELEKVSTVKFTPPVIKRDEEVQSVSRSVGAPGGMRREMAMAAAPAPMMAKKSMADSSAGLLEEKELSESVVVGYGTTAKQPAADLSAVPVRADFRETALWQPAVRTNAQGEVVLEFKMPEAVTRWQLLALAHTPDLQTGLLARQLVTQKQLMVTPNAPRFFREGDQLRLTAKISSLAASALSGTAQLQLLDARTNQPLDAQLLKSPAQVTFSVGANQSTTVGWDLSIPADQAVPLEAVTYRVVAEAKQDMGSTPPHVEHRVVGKRKNGKDKVRKISKEEREKHWILTLSDGEENTLPVLPNRLLVTETLPLAITGAGTRTFELKKLTSTTSPTRRNQGLTLELTANPAWYAVQSLPYLMEYPYECAEQTFSRLYANLLAARIVQANPRIRPLLDEWKKAAASGDKNTFRSKLEQNQELKNLLLQETPWVREGQTDTERMRRLTELFDEPKLQAETQRAILRLQEMQSPSGAFPWFKQMPDNRYITQLIVAGFGKLRQLGAFDAMQDQRTADMLSRAVEYLDRELQNDYDRLRKQKGVKLADDHLGDDALHALYARSFWRQDSDPTLEKAAQPAYTYYRGQAAQYWPKRGRYLQGMAALVLSRAAQAKAAQPIMEALRQNAIHHEELGMYWKDVRPGYYWQQAPVETQSLLIEAFHEVAKDDKSVEEMKLWLLSHKRTHNWESTRATADACYALLLQGGRNWLEPTQPLQVTLGTTRINTTEGAEAGTGYVKRSFPAAEVRADMGNVTVQKTDAGVAWGGLYWQYFEQLDKITAAEKAPLTLTRQLFRETPGASGPVLTPMTAEAPLRVGEVLVVRLTLRTDRELEYVHLKDTRAAGLELISQTSGYRYQQGLGYYESPRDAATNFFLDFLPRGAHVFEYRLRAAQAGDFSSGISQVQCMYAPEFSSHSAGQRLRIGAQ
ncbi:hypothetical protein EJV47_13460 [Hymenobacter gummosus]|uniref:Alpha-2-macroglobulin domain-containing protein n=1 Tax=Hymenobacter gummosus TaxID=1776032 RepID=A0A431U1T4_9BACT|nr:MG2 domain-containing protein [Hymenobacter gummosus]RTQ49150.1 hypothetical protein EJV47_13460 [Hymenobacter gummosus]